jgi:hypothetical protein
MFNFISKFDLMKKSIYFSILLMITSMISISGQEIMPSEKSPWSISLLFAPKMGFDLFGSVPSGANESYLFSLDLRAENKFYANFSYSFGVNFNRNKKNVNEVIFDSPFPGAKYKSVGYLIEFPLQINYHLIKNAKKLDPYIKMSLRNSILNLNTFGTIAGENISGKTYDYLLLYDLGFGSHFQINKTISVIIESCIGYGVVYYRPKFGYYEGLLGMRYTFQ